MISCKYFVLVLSIAVAARSTDAVECQNDAPCMLLENCTGLYDLLKVGISRELTQLLRSLHCGYLGTKPKICCPQQFRESQAQQTTRQTTVHTRGSASLLPRPGVCGQHTVSDRIIGGTQTDIDEHPWTALLRYNKPDGKSGFYCGGSLIASRYVLTAAHCVAGLDLPVGWVLTQVRLGEWNISSPVDCLEGLCNTDGPIDVDVENIIVHEGYNANDPNQFNDIAILRLSRNVLYTDYIKPICLPVSNELSQSSFDGYDLEVVGWGKTENRSESDVKLKVRVPVVPTRYCNSRFQQLNRQIINKQVCAGGKAGRDACRGDSGGALTGSVDGNYHIYLVGIVSYGPTPCGLQNWPGVYTRVGAYVDWISRQMRP